MNGLLLNSSKSSAITREALIDIPTPASTYSWHPLPHKQVADRVVQEVATHGWDIQAENYGVSKNGMKMFGVVKIASNLFPDFTRAVGFRNSHDKSLAVGIAAGLSVMVCDNLCFGGESQWRRKHTDATVLDIAIPRMFGYLEQSFERMEKRVGELKQAMLTIDDARLMVVKVAEAKAIPSGEILPVLREFQNPCHEEFKEMTQWHLIQAFTERAKVYAPSAADHARRTLAKAFQLS